MPLTLPDVVKEGVMSELHLLEQAFSPGGEEGEGYPVHRHREVMHSREDALAEAAGPQGSEMSGTNIKGWPQCLTDMASFGPHSQSARG